MLASPLTQTIEQLTQSTIRQSAPVGGGDISQAARLTMADGQYLLVKWRKPSIDGMFTAEARGLTWLRATQTLRIPQVIASAETTSTCPAFILMEWLGRGSQTSASAAALGRGLAAMHQPSFPHSPYYGLDHDNFIGANPQRNQPHDNWVDFFREQRLGYQMELARKYGYLNAGRGQRLENLLARLGDWLPPQPPASLLHGDLWGGNWLVTTTGEATLIDPAVYYGHQEAELAFTELFGGFPPEFYAAYHETWPQTAGYAEHKELYNLYHLLNHLNLFGESYGGSVDAILRKYSY